MSVLPELGTPLEGMRTRKGELNGSGMYLTSAEAGSRNELLRYRIETVADPTGPGGAAKDTDVVPLPWSNVALRNVCWCGWFRSRNDYSTKND